MKKIQRYSVKPIFQTPSSTNTKYEIIGIKCEEDSDGIYVLYQDIINLIEDKNLAIQQLGIALHIINGDHREKKNGI
jgi:hypothetical protein